MGSWGPPAQPASSTALWRRVPACSEQQRDGRTDGRCRSRRMEPHGMAMQGVSTAVAPVARRRLCYLCTHVAPRSSAPLHRPSSSSHFSPPPAAASAAAGASRRTIALGGGRGRMHCGDAELLTMDTLRCCKAGVPLGRSVGHGGGCKIRPGGLREGWPLDMGGCDAPEHLSAYMTT